MDEDYRLGRNTHSLITNSLGYSRLVTTIKGSGLVAGGLDPDNFATSLDRALEDEAKFVGGGINYKSQEYPFISEFSKVTGGNLYSDPKMIAETKNLADFLNRKLHKLYEERNETREFKKRLFRIDLMVNFIAALISIGDHYVISFNNSELLELRKRAYKIFRKALKDKTHHLESAYKEEKSRIINSIYHGDDSEVKNLISGYLLSRHK